MERVIFGIAGVIFWALVIRTVWRKVHPRWAAAVLIFFALLAMASCASPLYKANLDKIVSRQSQQQQNTAVPNSTQSPPISSATSFAATQIASAKAIPFPFGTPVLQGRQYACNAAFIPVFTFLNQNFVETDQAFSNGDPLSVYGRVEGFYFIGVRDNQTPYYVRERYVCTQRKILPPPKDTLAAPTRTASRATDVSREPSHTLQVADFHSMKDTTITICAKTAEVRSGPDNSFSVVYRVNLADTMTAYGWIRDWFYVGQDSYGLRDLFIHNSAVCTLNQSQTKQQTNSAPQTNSTSDPISDYLKKQGYGEPGNPNPIPSTACNYPADTSPEAITKWRQCIEPIWTETADEYRKSLFGPCDTYLFNQWEKGKSDRYAPECTPTPRAP